MQPNILVSITGETEKEWQDKLQEIQASKITQVALFLAQSLLWKLSTQ